MNRIFIKYLKLYLLVFCLFIAKYSSSQVATTIHALTKDISLNVNGGSLIFFGDVKQNGFMPSSDGTGEWRWGGGLYLRKMLSPVWGVDVNFLQGELSGINTPTEMYFTAKIREYNISAVIMISEFVEIFSKKSPFDLYLKAGLGSLGFSSILMDIPSEEELSRVGYTFDGNQDYSISNALDVPVCLGLKYKLNAIFDLTFETSYRITDSDFLDVLEIKDSGNDSFSYTCLGITYKFAESKDNSKKSYKCIGF